MTPREENLLDVLREEADRHDGNPLDIVRHALNLASGANAIGVDNVRAGSVVVGWPDKDPDR